MSVIADFLAATELDELLSTYERLTLDADTLAVAEAVLQEWTDPQAVANILMYPSLISDFDRVAVLVRALNDPNGYLRLAGAIGVNNLAEDELELLDEEDRVALVQDLFELVRRDVEPTAARAALSLGTVLRPTEVGVARGLLTHPSEAVRRNLDWSIGRAYGGEHEELLPLLVYVPNFAEWTG